VRAASRSSRLRPVNGPRGGCELERGLGADRGRRVAASSRTSGGGSRHDRRGRRRDHARVRRHPPPHWQTALPDLQRLDSDGLLPRRAFDLVTAVSAEDVYVGNSPARSRPSTRASRRSSTSPTATTRRRRRQGIEGLRDAGSPRPSPYGYFAPPRAERSFTSHDMRLDDSRRAAARLEGLPGGLLTMGCL